MSQRETQNLAMSSGPARLRDKHLAAMDDSAVPRASSHPSNAGRTFISLLALTGVELSRLDEVAMKIRFVRMVGLEHVQASIGRLHQTLTVSPGRPSSQ